VEFYTFVGLLTDEIVGLLLIFVLWVVGLLFTVGFVVVGLLSKEFGLLFVALIGYFLG
jgi:hypothetical protein